MQPDQQDDIEYAYGAGAGRSSNRGGSAAGDDLYTSSDYSQTYPSQYGSASSLSQGYAQHDAASYQADLPEMAYSSPASSAGRSSPGPGDTIRIEHPSGGSSEHRYDDRNQLWTQRLGQWIVENDERVVNCVSMLGTAVIQGGSGLGGNAAGVGAGLMVAAGPGLYVVGREGLNALRGQQANVWRAASAALAAAGAIGWGAGFLPGRSQTYGNASAVVHGVGSGGMALTQPGGQQRPRQRQRDVESQDAVAAAASSPTSGSRGNGSGHSGQGSVPWPSPAQGSGPRPDARASGADQSDTSRRRR
ncbi:hypothetical protein ABGB07_43600 [Micromonosporaceae bacterium B7E4]